MGNPKQTIVDMDGISLVKIRTLAPNTLTNQ